MNGIGTFETGATMRMKLSGYGKRWIIYFTILIFQIMFCQLACLAAESNSCLTTQALPLTGVRIVNVSTEPELQNAMNNLQPGDTLLLANGTYNLTSSLYINGKDNVTIRGGSGCADVVLAGKGMDNPAYGNVPVGIWSNSRNTTIAHLTVRNTYDNTVIFNAGAQSPHLYSVNLTDAGSQFIKANPTDAANGIGVANGVVEYCRIEYTNGPPAAASHAGGAGYFNGISAHAADNWTLRNNLFKNLHNPDSSSYWWNPAVLFWNHSQNTITENNTFINTDRAIAYGLNDIAGSDHTAGIIRNNFIYLAPGLMSASRKADSDAQIIVWDSPSTLVYHNTVLTNANVNLSIEFRFGTAGAEARNNLADAPIGTRNGGTYAQSGNYLSAVPAMFAGPATGNLHLLDTTSTRANVIDRVAVLTAVPTDIDGETRPFGAAADIGADEFYAAPPSITLNPVITPTSLESQTIGGTKDSGAAVTVTTDTAASDGDAVVTGTNWSYTITGLAWGTNNVTVTATKGAGNSTVRNAAIVRKPRVDVALEGSGGGRVESDPAAILCPQGACSALFGINTTVRLFSTPDGNSILGGWSACAGLGDCTIPMDGDREITAIFDLKPVRIPGLTPDYYLSIGDACGHLGEGGTVQAREYLFTEELTLDRPVPVVLDGGYNKSYSGKSGRTTIDGQLIVQLGSLTVADIEIR
jgi:hypothetical protein